jgi:hypothetical protein
MVLREEVYLFNHIPKCAGVSYHALFNMIFGSDEVTHISLNLETEYKIDAETYRRWRVVIGHFGVRWNPILGPESRWLTALRDPVDRVVSTYFFWRHDAPRSPEIPYLNLAQTLSLDEFVQSDHYLVGQGISNAQTWQLADDFRVRYRSVSEQDALEVAKANLSRFDFIGLYESFPQSAARLCDYLGVPVPPQLPHENETSNRWNVDELSPATVDLIKARNEADLALYEYAKILVNQSHSLHAGAE